MQIYRPSIIYRKLSERKKLPSEIEKQLVKTRSFKIVHKNTNAEFKVVDDKIIYINNRSKNSNTEFSLKNHLNFFIGNFVSLAAYNVSEVKTGKFEFEDDFILYKDLEIIFNFRITKPEQFNECFTLTDQALLELDNFGLVNIPLYSGKAIAYVNYEFTQPKVFILAKGSDILEFVENQTYYTLVREIDPELYYHFGSPSCMHYGQGNHRDQTNGIIDGPYRYAKYLLLGANTKQIR